MRTPLLLTRLTRANSTFAFTDAQAMGVERNRKELPLNSSLISLTHAQVDAPIKMDTINGVTVVSQGPRLPIVSLALSVPAGSVYERQHINGRCDAGVSQLYRHALLKTNAFRSEQFMTRYFEENAVKIGTERSRSNVLIRADGPQGSLNDVTEMLLKMVSHFRIKEHELEFIKELAKIENAVIDVQPVKLLIDLAYQAAYAKDGLSNPLYTPNGQLDCIDKDQLDAFGQSVISATEHKLVGVGVEDEELFKAMLESFGYQVVAKEKKRLAKFTKASELYQHDVFKYEHDHAALFWEIDDIKSAQLFCHFYNPKSKIPFGTPREPFGLSLGDLVQPFYDYNQDGGIYGLMFKFPRGVVNPGRMIEKALEVIKKSSEDEDALEFALLSLEQERKEMISSQYKRISLLLDDNQMEFKGIKMPSAHRKSKSASLVIIGDTRRLPQLSDLQ